MKMHSDLNEQIMQYNPGRARTCSERNLWISSLMCGIQDVKLPTHQLHSFLGQQK